jgi:hypothetical protein
LALILRQARGQNAVAVTDGYLIRAQGYFPRSAYGEFAGFYGWEISGYLGGW